MSIKHLLILALCVWPALSASSFCGFYVAKAGAKLYNKSSQVILARDGDRTVVTMSNDFSGDVKDFALVVPVPQVLKREQIRVVESNIFQKLDDYSAPRLVEYHDNNPCEMRVMAMEMKSTRAEAMSDEKAPAPSATDVRRKVTVEARYEVGEYEILILSAQESSGLTEWLIEHGYNIPAQAREVLEPYIKTKLKFFVAKVNLKKYTPGATTALRPLQITYDYDKFMLPIRLGMANANGPQDLTIYAFARQGRIECANYLSLDIPTDRNIPVSIKDRFAQFYKAVFDRAWKKAGERAVMLEYGWDISSNNYLKCDPCPSQPPLFADLKDAGAFWLEPQRGGGTSDYQGDVYISRLHVRYDRDHFPEDLLFIQTPNKANFQARYIITHPATGDLSCAEGRNYLKQLGDRFKMEDDMLAALTGWENGQPPKQDRDAVPPVTPFSDEPSGPSAPPNTLLYGVVLTLFALLAIFLAWRQWLPRLKLKF